jgi:hypothetical protein
MGMPDIGGEGQHALIDVDSQRLPQQETMYDEGMTVMPSSALSA